jgi:hypothetical protein
MSGTATETQRVRQEVRRTVRLARDALDHLDPTQAIAACRSLRSMLWRAQREGIAVAAPAPDPPAPAPD